MVIYQKLEKDTKKQIMVRRIRDKLFLILFLSSCIIAQNENRFDIVDWEIYSQPLKI
ncbi:MAG: hypothetical protein Ct9H90mP15_03000 [Candidatus Neomarinimicrobiota bacterium]|nr:MAG: hypothetical protein Ct9H90mP15_03000 [Candidatus Neomarinimicrobiota bacterium]